jgi:ketosteroid isomerase-like protein
MAGGAVTSAAMGFAPGRLATGSAASKEELVERLFDAFGRRDLSSVVDLVQRDVVFQPMTATVTRSGEPYRGDEGMRRYLADIEEHWQELTVKPVQIRAAGQAVVVLGMVSGRGVAGSFEDVPATWVLKFRDGLVAHIQIFSDARHVVDALGEVRI